MTKNNSIGLDFEERDCHRETLPREKALREAVAGVIEAVPGTNAIYNPSSCNHFSFISTFESHTWILPTVRLRIDASEYKYTAMKSGPLGLRINPDPHFTNTHYNNHKLLSYLDRHSLAVFD